MKQRTLQSEIGILEHVILKHARDAFLNQEKIDEQWRHLNYTSQVNFMQACREYDIWCQLFSNADIKINWVGKDANVSLDSIYVRDTSVMTDHGAIFCNMGKNERQGEAKELKKVYDDLGIPVLGNIKKPGVLEGGDTVWLAPDILAVGLTYRTNLNGIEQLKVLSENKFEIIEVDLPHFRGSADVFHLMSIISPIDHDLVLVYSRLMPIRFRDFLLAAGFQLIEVPDQEFDSMGINVLAIAPRKCIMLAENPITKKRLEANGVKIITYRGQEISVKGMGGPTCLTRPLWRMI